MKWLKDTAERVARTAVVTWLGYWVSLSGHDFVDLFGHQALLVTATAAAGTLLLCLGAAKVSTSEGEAATASFAPDPAPKPRKKAAKK